MTVKLRSRRTIRRGARVIVDVRSGDNRAQLSVRAGRKGLQRKLISR